MKTVQKLWKNNKSLFHSFCELSYAINSSLKPDIILEHWDEIKKHPPFGYKIMAPLSLSEEVKLAILHHQDVKSYPGN